MEKGTPCVRQKQVLGLGFYRTGSQSLKEALTILGYKDVWHASTNRTMTAWRALSKAADANITSISTYNGQGYGREQWDEIFASSEALTDVTPFSLSLLSAYPDAKVILVHREFDGWFKSYLETLVLPSYSWTGWFSGTFMERLVGCPVSQTVWKLYMGLSGVSSMKKTKDKRVMRIAYDRHYDLIRRLVPPGQLLECKLGDGWEPICTFLDKPIPSQPFPRLNESKELAKKFTILHRVSIILGMIKICVPLILAASGYWFAPYVLQFESFSQLDGTRKDGIRAIFGAGGLLAGLWWSFTHLFL